MKNHSMSNFEVRSLLLFSALVLGTTFTAHAQQAAASCNVLTASNMATTTDRNRPRISNADAAFNRADTDRDGKLSPKEAEHFPAMSPHFQLIDTDHDNFLSRDELNQGAANNI